MTTDVSDYTVTTTGNTSNTNSTVAHDDRPDYESLYRDALKDAETWQKRFTGLQGKYQQERDKWSSDAGKLMEFDDNLTKTMGELDALRTELESLTSAKEAAESEKEILSSQMERLTIVTTEFPHLVPFLKDDLLPDSTGDDMRNKLTVMTSRLGEIQKEKIKEVAAGSSLSDSPAASPDTPEKLMRQIANAITTGDMKTYEQLYDQLIKIESK